MGFAHRSPLHTPMIRELDEIINIFECTEFLCSGGNKHFVFLVGTYPFKQRSFDKAMSELETKLRREGYYDNRYIDTLINKSIFLLSKQDILITLQYIAYST